MKKLLIMFLLCLPFVAAAEECDIDQPVCFGIAWNTATIDDIKGIDVNARDSNGHTPLHFSIRHDGNPEIILALLKAGADVKAKTRYGEETAYNLIKQNEKLENISAYWKLHDLSYE